MRFGLFSDLHSNLPGLPERGYGGRSLDDLKRGLARFREAGVAFAVSLGDNTQPARDAREQAAQLSDLIRLWNGYGFPVHTVFGNHEFQQLTLDEVLSVWRTERAYDCFSVDGIRFVILDTNIRPDGVHYGADNFDWRFGVIDEAQAAWLRDLLTIPARTFVFTHNCLRLEIGDPHDDWFRVCNCREICDLLAASGCVEAVFQGHHHTAHTDTWNGIRFLNIPSPERSPAYDDADFPIIEVTPDGFTVNGTVY